MSSTATIEDTAPALSQPDTSILFMARRRDLRLIKVPRYPIRGMSGQQVDQSLGEAIQFVEGRFFCPTEGTVRLDDGREADAAEVLTFLEKHRLNGHVEEGFWRVDPVAPPPSEAEFQALMDAATEFDEDALVAIVSAERAGWAREALINTGERAIERIREIKIKAQEQAAADAAAQAAAATTPPPPAAKAKTTKADPPPAGEATE